VKNTYGTGCFLLMNTGNKKIMSQGGLLTTLAADQNGRPVFALEGSVFIAGAALQWLRDELKIIEQATASEAAALSVPDNGGVYLVPAFAGLGAPHWDMEARGIVTGLTRGSNRNHLIRAALESMAYQTDDVLELMEKESGLRIPRLNVDGGAAANYFLLQFQADISQRVVVRPADIESTARGAAGLAGLPAGVLEGGREFEPAMAEADRRKNREGWEKALRQAKAK
jgi:glycerol kinase